MTRTLDLHPEALAEAEAAAQYYAARNIKASVAFSDALLAAIREIESAPHIFPAHVNETRRLLLRTFPFSVVYIFDEQRIFIIAVAHGSRRPGYWISRLTTKFGPG
ncbi:MAG TPA: type II toxin-antitoxin system RelE/ParE family toxin [Polyangiaceae bacterium]|nr:type II toxin-antitoxin system RelE/ParE family toxin [Polyangiaceae bacterium]